MANDRVRMDRDLLRGTAGVLWRQERQMDSVRDEMTPQDFRLESDDPVQVHPHFLKAFRTFRDTWLSEIDQTANAAGEVAAELVATADGLKETDSINGDGTPQVPDGPGGGAGPR